MSGQTEYITKGSSQFSVVVNLLQDNSGSNPGDPLTGLVYNSTNLACYYKSGGTGTVTQLSLATQTSSGSFSLGGFAQLSSANMPGAYRLDLSTTLFSSSDNFGQVMLSGYADLAAHAVHVKFFDHDLYQSINDALSTYGVSTMTSTHTILLSSDATSAQLVDDIWDESSVGHTSQGTHGWYNVLSGAVLVDTTITTTPGSTAIALVSGSTVDDFYNDQLAYIVSGTGIGQVRPVVDYDGTNKILYFDEALAVVPSTDDRIIVKSDHVHPLTQIKTQVTSGLSTYGASTHTSTDIQDLLPSNFSSVPVSTDGEISSVLLSSAATSAQLVDDIMDEGITGADHNVNNSLAKFIREASESAVLASGTATSGTATTIVLSSGEVTTDNIFDGERVAIIEGTGAGQSRLIQSSSASSDTLTVESQWVTNPDATSVYVIQGAEASIRAVAGQSVTATATVNYDNFSTLTSTDVNDQVKDVLTTDTFSLPGQGAPTATPTIQEALGYLYKSWRNKKDNDGSTTQLYADDGSTVDQKQATAVTTAGVVSKAEWITGP